MEGVYEKFVFFDEYLALSQIAHLDMHHLVFGINFQIHSVSLTILV